MAEARWNDLNARIATALALLAVGVGAILLGGPVLALVVAAAAAAMIWELATMTAPEEPRRALLLAGLAGIGMAFFGAFSGFMGLGLLLLVPMLGSWQKGRSLGPIFFFYALLILLGCLSMLALRNLGVIFVGWAVLVVIASDIGGYFGGRLIGGPKFWPAVSPKKTWSGTVAGWVLAAIVGAVVVSLTGAPGATLTAMAASALLAFVAQMGDIAESAIKRRVGVKDSSQLLPGHGGVLDRFDAMIAAFTAMAIFMLLVTLLGGA